MEEPHTTVVGELKKWPMASGLENASDAYMKPDHG